MIRVESKPLPDNVQSKLDVYQNQVNDEPTYKKQVAKAKSSFKSKNVKNNRTFTAVKRTLDKMCSGARRCHYCEDSAADEVEHFYPKDLYPECCFFWPNYLYSCGRCNGSYKSNKFKIFKATNRTVIDITPPRTNRRYVKPPAGDPLLLDPRADDPLDFIQLSLQTFKFKEIAGEGTEEYQRGHWTIECLGLNAREVLVDARYEAYENYLARLERYMHRQDTAPDLKLEKMVHGIKTMSHPTVWKEMIRQHQSYDELKELFEAVPEALDW